MPWVWVAVVVGAVVITNWVVCTWLAARRAPDVAFQYVVLRAMFDAVPTGVPLVLPSLSRSGGDDGLVGLLCEMRSQAVAGLAARGLVVETNGGWSVTFRGELLCMLVQLPAVLAAHGRRDEATGTAATVRPACHSAA
jgi:hypothetical protein